MADGCAIVKESILFLDLIRKIQARFVILFRYESTFCASVLIRSSMRKRFGYHPHQITHKTMNHLSEAGAGIIDERKSASNVQTNCHRISLRYRKITFDSEHQTLPIRWNINSPIDTHSRNIQYTSKHASFLLLFTLSILANRPIQFYTHKSQTKGDNSERTLN